MKAEYSLNLSISSRALLPLFFISEESLPEPAGAMSSLWVEIHNVVQCLGVLGPGHIRDVQVGIPRGQVVSDH